jgi:hypothetical protein
LVGDLRVLTSLLLLTGSIVVAALADNSAHHFLLNAVRLKGDGIATAGHGPSVGLLLDVGGLTCGPCSATSPDRSPSAADLDSSADALAPMHFGTVLVCCALVVVVVVLVIHRGLFENVIIDDFEF